MPQEVELAGKKYYLVPKRMYEELTRAERDQRDAEIARKASEAYRAGKLKTVSLQAARKKWGV
jgi:hypothetical protein